MPAPRFLDESTIQRLLQEARQAPRKRVMFCFSGHEDPIQRMVNVMQPGAYPRPHRHPRPGTKESFAVLRGAVGLFLFDGASGEVTGCWRLDPRERPAADIPSGSWHSFMPLEEDTVVFETKTGPWNAETDKEFAAWAPDEGTPEADAFREKLLAILGNDH